MQHNKEKITREFCWKKELIFFPTTREEATFIQEKLLGMGYQWGGGNKKVSFLDECVWHGIVLMNDKIYHRAESDNRDYLVCNISQFQDGAFTRMTAEEQSLMIKAFNKLSARIDELSCRVEEAIAKVDAIHDEIFPKELDKPKAVTEEQKQAAAFLTRKRIPFEPKKPEPGI